MALSREDWGSVSVNPVDYVREQVEGTYGLCDIVDDDGAVGIPVIHGSEGFVAFLSGGIPYLEFDCGSIVEGDGLREEGSADG